MSNFGFGNNDHNDRDDHDDHNGRDDQNGHNNPFGMNGFGFFFGPGMNMPGGTNGNNPGGNLGDLFGQLGNLFGMPGNATATPNGSTGLDFQAVQRSAQQHILNPKPTPVEDSHAIAESARLVELWLDEATDFPAAARGSVAFGPRQWIDETTTTWERLLTPLIEKLNDQPMSGLAMPGMPGMPEGATPDLGPLEGILRQFNNMNMAAALGAQLAALSKTVVMSTQWGIPLSADAVVAINTYHLDKLMKIFGCEKHEAIIYLAAREAAHHRLFAHTPWLLERIILDIEEFAAGLELDTTDMQEAMSEFNPEMLNDPAQMQEMMQRLQGMDTSPKVVSSHAHARERLETTLSLIEGWVDVVVANALEARFPQVTMIHAAWTTYRAEITPGQEALLKSYGLSLAAPQADAAAELWVKLEQAVGRQRRDQVWNHPDFLPDTSDLGNPAAFIGQVKLDGEELSAFNPISEIEKLEEELRRLAEQQDEENNDNDKDAD